MTSFNRLVTAVALWVLAGPLAADAQQTGKVYRLGILTPAGEGNVGVIVIRLRELGYVEGRNLVVERRLAGGRLDRLPGLARELVQLQPDVIVAVSATAIEAAKDATRTVPIVMVLYRRSGRTGLHRKSCAAWGEHHWRIVLGGVGDRWEAPGADPRSRPAGQAGCHPLD